MKPRQSCLGVILNENEGSFENSELRNIWLWNSSGIPLPYDSLVAILTRKVSCKFFKEVWKIVNEEIIWLWNSSGIPLPYDSLVVFLTGKVEKYYHYKQFCS